MQDAFVQINQQLLGSYNVDAILLALDVIDKQVDHPDCALNFAKLGGLDVFIPLITALDPRIAGHEAVQARALGLMTLCLQHNPELQAEACKRDLITTISPLALRTQTLTRRSIEDDGEVIRFHAVSCLGAMIRNNLPLEHHFITINGLALLRTCYSRSAVMGYGIRTRKKILSFMLTLVQSDLPPISAAAKQDVVQVIISEIYGAYHMEDWSDLSFWELSAQLTLRCLERGFFSAEGRQLLIPLITRREICCSAQIQKVWQPNEEPLDFSTEIGYYNSIRSEVK